MKLAAVDPLDHHTVRRLAVEAICDPRTVHSYLLGRPVRGAVRFRIEAALRRLRLRRAPGAAQERQTKRAVQAG